MKKIQTKQKSYKEFIRTKKHLLGEFGFEPTWIPEIAFDFQEHIIRKAIRKGRMAVFADTGLGKTLIQLSIAENIVRHTNKRVLIIAPLAVAFQFIDEAEKIGVPDIEYSKNGIHSSKIVICNYERLHYFDSKDFEGVICDESSILKNFDGKIKNQVTSFVKKIPYRFLSTATPSPNDYIELGTSSEALGYMGYMDMLGKFFKNNQSSIDPKHAGEKFYLKPHAEKDFWTWVGQWSISVKKPSDLGYSDEKYVLPKLTEVIHYVRNTKPLVIDGQTQLFTIAAKSFHEIRAESKATIEERCNKAYELSLDKDSTVFWCNLNDEANYLESLDDSFVQIKGGMSIDKKEEILRAFSKGEIKKLITKPKISSFGLNWQHCNHTTYFPTYSFEQYYQAIRRFWRFGQKNEVQVDLIASDGQNRIIDSLNVKKEKAIKMFEMISNNVNGSFHREVKEFNKQIIKPNFI
jgi:hypothetical protein